MENNSRKILWDVTIKTDTVVIDKTKNECKIIDFSCPFGNRIEEREKDKIKGSNDKRELKKMWDMPVKEIPVVAGALGMTPKKLK